MALPYKINLIGRAMVAKACDRFLFRVNSFGIKMTGSRCGGGCGGRLMLAGFGD